MTDRFSMLLNALRRANLRQDVVVDVVQQQPAVVEHVVLFHDRFEGNRLGKRYNKVRVDLRDKIRLMRKMVLSHLLHLRKMLLHNLVVLYVSLLYRNLKRLIRRLRGALIIG